MVSVEGLRTMGLVVVRILNASHLFVVLVLVLVLVAVASPDLILARDTVGAIGAVLAIGTGEDFAAWSAVLANDIRTDKSTITELLLTAGLL